MLLNHACQPCLSTMLLKWAHMTNAIWHQSPPLHSPLPPGVLVAVSCGSKLEHFVLYIGRARLHWYPWRNGWGWRQGAKRRRRNSWRKGECMRRWGKFSIKFFFIFTTFQHLRIFSQGVQGIPGIQGEQVGGIVSLLLWWVTFSASENLTFDKLKWKQFLTWNFSRLFSPGVYWSQGWAWRQRWTWR